MLGRDAKKWRESYVDTDKAKYERVPEGGEHPHICPLPHRTIVGLFQKDARNPYRILLNLDMFPFSLGSVKLST